MYPIIRNDRADLHLEQTLPADSPIRCNVDICRGSLTGFFPSHLSFLLRHLSQACDTRFRGPCFPGFCASSIVFSPPSLRSANSPWACGAIAGYVFALGDHELGAELPTGLGHEGWSCRFGLSSMKLRSCQVILWQS